MTVYKSAIGVDQPPRGGDSYPLVNPPDNVQGLLADLYLAYEDPSCEFSLPFHLVWLYGFGDGDCDDDSEFPDPEHDHDVLIRDDNGVTVFDSTLAEYITPDDWSEAYRILEWRNETAILRIVQHTGEPENEPPVTYGECIVTDAVLDARTLKVVPSHVKGFVLGESDIPGPDVEFEAGYNTLIEVVPQEVTDGTPRVTRLVFHARPGAGLGRFPECSGDNRYLRSLGGQRPNDRGQVFLTGDPCYRVSVPIEISEGVATITPHTLLVENDCEPCLDCNDVIRVYRGITNASDQEASIYQRIEAARVVHLRNLQRWEDQKACREARNLKLTLLSGCPSIVNLGGAYTNISECCLYDLELRFTFRVFHDGVEVDPEDRAVSAVCGQTHAGGSPLDGVESYSLGGVWPVLLSRFDFVNSGDTDFLRFGSSFENAVEGDVLEVTLTAHSPSAAQCGLSSVSVDSEITDLWSDSPATVIAVTKKYTPIYPQCDC